MAIKPPQAMGLQLSLGRAGGDSAANLALLKGLGCTQEKQVALQHHEAPPRFRG